VKAEPSTPRRVAPLRLAPCEPIEEHAALVMAWRNDPTTLAMFFHHEPKVWESFWPEFRDRYFADPSLPPAFALDGGRAVAFLRFERVTTGSEASPDPSLPNPELSSLEANISINVPAEFRRRGYGERALLGSLDYLRDRGIASCWAEIRVENEPSQRAFERAGWRLVDEVDKTVVDTGEVCRIRRYVVSL